MQSLQEVSSQSKYVPTEPCATELRHCLGALEGEWRQASPLMDAELQQLFQEAHRTLGLLHEELDARQTARIA